MKIVKVVSIALIFTACSSAPHGTQQSPTAAQTVAPAPKESLKTKPLSSKELEKLLKQQSAAPTTANGGTKATELEKAAARANPANYKIVPEIDLNEWKLIGSDDDVKTYQKKQDLDGLVAFRGEALIPTSIVKIAAVFDDASIRKDWIDALVEGKVIAQPNRLQRIEYNHTSVPWPFQDRDFIYDVNVEISRNPNMMILRMKSGDDKLLPPIDGVVRGKLVYCYYHMKEIEPNKSTYVIVEIVVDPMGNVPKWLVNLTSKKWPQHTLSGLRKVAQRDNLTIPSDLEQYYMGPKQ